MSVEEDIGNHLATGLGGSWAAGTNIFTGYEKPEDDTVPGQAIFVVGTGGAEDSPLKDGTTLATPTAQVLVRSERHDYAVGLALADQVLLLLRHRPPSGYYDATAASSRATPLPPTDTGHPRWTINMTLSKLENQ